MKIKKICALALIIVMSLSLASCGNRLNGTYRSQGLIAQTFTFNGDNVTMSAFGINTTGTYKVDGDEITIVYTLFGSEYEWTQPFSKSGNTINIGGTDFVKQ